MPSAADPAYVALGTSLGHRAAQLDEAVARLGDARGVRVLRGSAIYDTAPAGGVAKHRFLNAVIELESELTPRALLGVLHEVEAEMGRERQKRWEDRTIDLDLLLWGERVIDEDGLTLPHPRLQERTFVLRPLADLAPAAVHPILGRTVAELLDALRLDLENDGHDRLVPAPPGVGTWTGWLRR